MSIQDAHGRSFRTLRVSLTNACNFGCVYCVNGLDQGGINRIGAASRPALGSDELAQIVVALHRILDFKTVRLTGGEPTLYEGLIPFIGALTSNGIRTIRMTTNGFLLRQKAKALARAGIGAINVSLDAVDPGVFAAVSRRSLLPQVLEGIDAARDAGIEVKLNAVIMRGLNEDQIIPLLEYASARAMQLRYLELMRMGHFYSDHFDRYFFPMQEILDTIRTRHTLSPLVREPSATATRWKCDDGTVFGIIANESEPFCSDCDRLRLDSFGTIYGCLSEEKSEYVGDIAGDVPALEEKLRQALAHKQPLKFKGSSLAMISIGG
ncbi:MAG: GTP 3',8-cyclase MoaA [Acidobacteriota bacterium]